MNFDYLQAPSKESLKRSLQQLLMLGALDKKTVDFENGIGNAKERTYHIMPVQEYSNVEIRNIRMNAGMTQTVLANYMGVSKKTVEAWECGRTHPTGPAYRLLSILKSDKKEALEFLEIK